MTDTVDTKGTTILGISIHTLDIGGNLIIYSIYKEGIRFRVEIGTKTKENYSDKSYYVDDMTAFIQMFIMVLKHELIIRVELGIYHIKDINLKKNSNINYIHKCMYEYDDCGSTNAKYNSYIENIILATNVYFNLFNSMSLI
jgi:hypothetical protein